MWLYHIKAYLSLLSMSLKKWWESRTSCPKYICFCSCCLRNKCCHTKYCDRRTDQDVLEDNTKASDELSLFDLWSFSHVFTGMLTSIPVFFIEWYWSYLITFLFAFFWEIFENSKLGVRMWNCLGYKKYNSDHFYNSVTDIVCNSTGFLIMLSGYVIFF